MDFKKVSEDLLSFVQQSPTAFHAVNNIAERLKQDGFVQLLEGDHWDIEKGKKYFTTRNDSSIIAFKVGNNLEHYSFNIATAHSDNTTVSNKATILIALLINSKKIQNYKL